MTNNTKPKNIEEKGVKTSNFISFSTSPNVFIPPTMRYPELLKKVQKDSHNIAEANIQFFTNFKISNNWIEKETIRHIRMPPA